MTGSGQDTVVTLRDAGGHPVRVGRENGYVIVQVAKTAPLRQIRLDAPALSELLRALAADPLADIPGEPGGPAGDGECKLIAAFAAGQIEWLYWNRPAAADGGQELRPLDPEEARALGYAGSDPPVLLRREDDGTVFEIGITVTARQVHPAPAGAAGPGKEGPR
jgi:hypothetical protein